MRRGRLFLVLLAALIGPGCPGNVGERLGFSVVSACFKVEQAQETVFRSAQEWQAFVQSHGGLPGPPAPDFSRGMVAAHFDGGGSACTGFTVEEARLAEGRLVISATRHTSPGPCVAVLAYPQVLVLLPVQNAPVVFRIGDARDDVARQTPVCS
jgi:hypothetical protein